MSTPTKTILSPNPVVQALLAANGNFIGAVLDFATKFSGAIYWDFAPVATTAGPVATMLQLLAQSKDSAPTEDDSWGVVQEWLSPTAVPTRYNAIVSGTAGANTISVTGAPAITLFQDHYIRGATDNEAGGEWVYPISQSGVNVTLRGNLKNTYANIDMFSAALRLRFEQDFTNLKNYKVAIFNNRTGTKRDVVNRVRITTLDSVG